MMGALQKAEQRPVRTRLGHAMQVEPGIDLLAAARQVRALAAADRRQRRRFRSWRRNDRRRRRHLWRGNRTRRGLGLGFRRSDRRLRSAVSLAQWPDLPGYAFPERLLLPPEAALAPPPPRQFPAP